MSRQTFDWIRHHGQLAPEKIALIDLHSGRRLSYRELDTRVGAVTSFLRATTSVRPQGTVAVLCHNSSDVLEVQFACRRLPARFLPLNWRLTAPELEYILREAEVAALLVGAEFEELGRHAAAQAGGPVVLTMNDGEDSDYERGITEWRDRETLPIPRLDEDVVWTVMYTSGTTGRPKGALIRYGMVESLVTHLVAKVGLSTATVDLSILPMFHISGLNTYANPVLCLGGTVYVMRTFDAKTCLDLIGDPANGLTHFMGVPTHFLMMTERPEFSTARFDHLESVTSGGQAVPIPMVELYSSKGMRLQQGWGMTESCSLIFLLMKEDIETKRGSVGKPVMNVEIRIVDENGADVRPGQVGELLLRGPQISDGYLNKPDANAAQWSDGWFKTGDAFRVDEDGYFYIVDRWKDMYISGGENVYPAEVERVIFDLPQVLEVAVVGIPHPRWGEVGRAFIVRRTGATPLDEGAVVAHCRANLARYKVPAEVVFAADLPHTPAGKVQKHSLSRAPLAWPTAEP